MSTQKSSPRRLVVTGATGKQGGALISALLSHNEQSFQIYAVTRNRSSASAQSLASKPNVKVIEGDFDRPEAIFQQVENVWGLFSVSTISGRNGAEKEEAQGKAMTEAALKAGVEHIVYTSVDRGRNSDTDATPIPHFASKKNIEDHLKEKTMGTATTWTFLRPVMFMDNITPDMIGKVFMEIWYQNGADRKNQVISSKDIGRVGAEAFLHASEPAYKNKSISLAGDELSPDEAARIFEEVTGGKIPRTYSFFGTLAKWAMADELGKMFAWFKSTGFEVDVPALKKSYPFLKDFRSWLEEESAWRKK